MSEKVRVRFAPSPTGPLHMGGVRTALYNYLFAKKHGGDFILRIEDTDEKRFVEGAQQYIIDSLKWCGIEPNEGAGYGGEFGPYIQSERKDIYKPYAEQLVESGHAYIAFDTPEELENMREQAKKMGLPNWQYNGITRSSMKNSLSLSKEEVEKRLAAGEPYSIRMKMPRNQDIKFEDIIRGWVTVNTNNLDDKILYKPSGMPTYHLANIVDDHTMKITHVIRGEEWLPSAPLHVLLYDAFGWDRPQFAHLPLILRPDGNGKLSKRDGDRLGFPVFPLNWTTAEGEIYSGYKESGYFPEAFINMLSLLGWNPGNNEEIFSLEEMVDKFSLERVGKSGARFDPDKTKWFNQQYLRSTDDQSLSIMVKPHITGTYSDEYIAAVCGLMKERATFIQDIVKEGDYFFTEISSYDEKTVQKKWKEDTPEIMQDLIAAFEGITDWNTANIEAIFSQYLEKNEYGFGKVGPGFRLLVTGKGMGPSMFDICAVLGKEVVLKRMREGLDKVNALKTTA
ncbi:glutamate--tRNA ligase [Paracrocinitomix mangrovi]|uniref:glutamate--tRNA ligase n=1 Tax=Paracrocinitomix mangrovi TaxID=2862509 RepID=UPI001C8DBDF9|nr:glutamate--tRNA ligase [Paracrocinitomix mangrovi]UKN00550.1 glutamate--tRNA ligase [Paracrocinitomix mangrovi]